MGAKCCGQVRLNRTLHLVLLLASELYNLGYVAFSSKDTFYITYKHLQ